MLQGLHMPKRTPPSVKPIVTDEQRRGNKAAMLFQAFRQVDQTMPMQLAYTFLLVALHDGISVTEVADLAGFRLATASRHLLDLGERNRKKEPGLGLVKSEVDPDELRRKIYTLTPKGRNLYNTILNAMS